MRTVADELQERYRDISGDTEKCRAMRMRIRLEKLLVADEAYQAARLEHANALTVLKLNDWKATVEQEHRAESAAQALRDASDERDRAITSAVGAI